METVMLSSKQSPSTRVIGGPASELAMISGYTVGPYSLFDVLIQLGTCK